MSGGSLGKNVPGTGRECEGWRGRVAGVEEASDPMWRAFGFSFGEDGEPLEALSKVWLHLESARLTRLWEGRIR